MIRSPGGLAPAVVVAVVLGAVVPASAQDTPSADDLAKELVRRVRAFEMATLDFRQDVGRVIDLNYEEKRHLINQGYGSDLKSLEEEERKRRLDAIGLFEEFLRKYPDNPVYTPDAMFRLAELYFEKANDEYLLALDRQEELMDQFASGEIEEEPQEPIQDYSRTIELFQALTTDFPDYRHADGAYYLLGYCLTETGESEQGKDMFLALIEKYPESRFIPEAWMRVGEYYFDLPDLKAAANAYQHVLTFEDSPYYDRALYKLAWTYYRMDDFEEAIANFKALVEYADAKKKETGTTGSELRAEAIEYLAISLAEEDWDGDGLPDDEPPVQRAFRYITGAKPYEVEVLRKLGDIFFDNTRYKDALAIYRYLVEKYPNDPSNPQVGAKIIASLERLQRIDEAFAEREKFAEMYGEGTPWYEANKDDIKAIKKADVLAEESLIAAAIYHHDKAQGLKDRAQVMNDPALLKESQKYYELAARDYRKYLDKYPHSKNAYELNFYYADCLNFSYHFLEAARQYERVRDASPDGKYHEEAALAAIIAYEQHIEELVKKGELPPEASPTYEPPPEEETEEGAKVEPKPIPEIVETLVAARDYYVEHGLNNPDDPHLQAKMAFKAAEVFYRFDHFDEARKRLAAIIDKYPKEEVATLAAAYIIESYRKVKDWEKMAEWSARIEKAELGTPEEREKLREEVTTLKVGALFKKAQELFEAGKYEEAAKEYVRLVSENPKNKFADRALNNAAVAYEKLGKYESAMRLYERVYREYPDRQFAEYALYRVAINSERFFSWKKAVDSYLLLVDKFPNTDKKAQALTEAALLLEGLQDYRKAIGILRRYIKEFPDAEDIAWAYRKISDLYKKLGDTEGKKRALKEFVRKFYGEPKQSAHVLEALAALADQYQEEHDWRNASKYFRKVIKEYRARGFQPGTREAGFAAKAQFMLTEHEFKIYEGTKIKGTIGQQGKIIKRLQGLSRNLSAKYSLVFDYKVLEWTLAAYFRMAQLFQLFAEKLYDAPIPKAIAADEEAAEEYRVQLEDVAVPIEDEAVKRFETALQVARKNHVINRWTKRILEVLNKYKPSEYPLLKEEARPIVTQAVSGLPLYVPGETTFSGYEPTSQTAGGDDAK